MLNTNNEINIKKEKRKHSWSTVFAWLYLKTIGRILPKRWNKWAENILYYDKTTANNEVQTDAFKTVDESVQVDLKPEVTEKESQSVVISKDGGVQTDGVALCVEKVDKSVEVNLKPEVAEKDGEITSEDEGIYSKVSGGPTDEDCFDIEDEDKLAWDNDYKVYREDDEALQLDDMSQELELECSRNALLQKINEDLESKLATSNEGLVKAIETTAHLEGKLITILEENKQLKLQLAEYKKDYTELKNVSDQIEKELSVELEENLVEMRKKDEKISSLTRLNKALEQDKKKIETISNEQQQIAEIYMKLNELLSNVTEISEKTLQLHNQEQQEEKKSLENKVLELQKQVQILKGNKKWELAGIDGIFKEVFSNIMEMLEKGLYAVEGRDDESLKRQLTAQSVEIEELNKQLEKANEELEKLTLSYNGQADQIEELQSENDFLEEQNRELRSRNEELEEERSKVARLEEESAQSKVKFAGGIVKAFEDLERKCMKTGSLTLLDEELGASVEKLSDQLHKVKSMERQQFQSTQGYQQQSERETIDLESKIKDLSSQLDAVEKEKKDLKNKVSELQKQVQTLEGSKENVQKKFTDVSNQKGVELEKSKKNAKTLETALSNQKKEWEADSNKKAKEIENLKGSKRKLEKNLQEKNQELVKQKELAEQATKEVTKLTSKIKNGLDEVNKLQKERRNMEEQLKIMQQRLSDNQEQQNEKTKKSQERTKIQRKPLQDKNLEHFLSDRNMGLKKDFPEFKEKNFFLNFLRETVKLVSNKQDDKFQGRELLNLFKSNLKELAKETIENRVKEVVINKGNKYYQVSKNIDKELLDGTIRRDKLKDELSHSVERYMKKLELDVKDATTITNSIIDKLCNKENNNKSPALREIVVRDLTEARMKIFLEKVKEINLVPNNVPNSFMSHTNNTKHVLSLGNVRTGS